MPAFHPTWFHITPIKLVVSELVYISKTVKGNFICSDIYECLWVLPGDFRSQPVEESIWTILAVEADCQQMIVLKTSEKIVVTNFLFTCIYNPGSQSGFISVGNSQTIFAIHKTTTTEWNLMSVTSILFLINTPILPLHPV